MLQVTFPEVAKTLEDLSSSVPAAEAHGCLCGALCTTAHYSMERWLEEIIPEEDKRADDDSQQALRLLYADTLNAVRGEEMDLELLLPDDDSPLEARASALSLWCQGFLYGFGTGAPVKAEELPTNVDEVLRDLTHIGRASVELEGGGEEEETAYTEVVEYVRVGVQLVHDELDPLRDGETIARHGDDDDGGAADDYDYDPDDPATLN